MQIYLKTDSYEMQLPVLPEGYSVTEKQNNQTANVVSFGDVNLKGNRGLREMSLSSFFPASKTHGGYKAQAKFKEPFTLVNKLISWKDKKTIVRVIVTETNVNSEFLINEVTYEQNDGTGDVNYSISLTEYARPKIKLTTNGVTTLATGRAKKEKIVNEYTVKSGDTLKSIAKKLLGSSSKFKKIANLNHIPSPYKIKAGQVLIVK